MGKMRPLRTLARAVATTAVVLAVAAGLTAVVRHQSFASFKETVVEGVQEGKQATQENLGGIASNVKVRGAAA
jgi:hypothetical protein